MSEGYRTYITGKNFFYDEELVKLLSRNVDMFFHVYQSNWRVLHIDGFEWEPLPRHTGRQLQFFMTTSAAPPTEFRKRFGEITKDGGIEWTNMSGNVSKVLD